MSTYFSVTHSYAHAFRPEYKGGFDVVIGNPPYVRSRELFHDIEKEFYLNTYETCSYQLDLYKLFIEMSLRLINKKGILSFITPSVFLTNDYDIKLRKFLLENYSILSIVHSDKDVFADASAKTSVFVIKRLEKPLDNAIKFYKIINTEMIFDKIVPVGLFIDQNYLINEKVNIKSISILNKLSKYPTLEENYKVKNGIKVRKELLFNSQINSDYKPFIKGRNVFPYITEYSGEYIHYKSENEKLYTNQAFREKEIFEQEKLITRQILGNRIITAFDDTNLYTDQTTYVILKKNEYSDLFKILCVLNSKLMYFYFLNTFSDNKKTFPKVKRSQLLKLPVPENGLEFYKFSDSQIRQINKLGNETSNFLNLLQSDFEIDKLSTKLQNWYELDFKQFVAELKKKKVELTLTEKAEWMSYFNEKKTEAQELKAKIEATDNEIDLMVYKLYDLTYDEVLIVDPETPISREVYSH